MKSVNNLDAQCAHYGFNLAEKVKDDTLITKTLGVLQEQGVYAVFLYLTSKEKKENAAKHLWRFLKDDSVGLLTGDWDPNKWPENLHQLLNNIDDLFFARSLMEQMLIYARYHAKSLASKQRGEGSSNVG